MFKVLLACLLMSVPGLYAMELDQVKLDNRFLTAAQQNDLGKVLLYLNQGAQVNAVDQQGLHAWDYALSFGIDGEALRDLLVRRNSISAPPLEAVEQPAQQTQLQAFQSPIGLGATVQPVAIIPNFQEEQTQVSISPQPSELIAHAPSAQVVAASTAHASQESSAGWSSWLGVKLYNGLATVARGGKKALRAAAKGARQYNSTLEFRKKIAEPDSYSPLVARVENSKTISDQEKQLIERRKIGVQQALQAFVGDALKITEQDIISMGACFSGGGVRAALETLGWLRGAEKIGFLALVQYAAGLSGSTWALNPWIASGLTLDQYIAQHTPRLTRPLTDYVKSMTRQELEEIFIVLGRRIYNRQSVGPVDLFGILLTKLFLQGLVDNPYSCTLSSLASSLGDGRYPFIISTAALQDTQGKSVCEFTPCAIESNSTRIPTWAFGRVFKDGESQIVQPRNLFEGEKVLANALIDLAGAYSDSIKQNKGSLKSGISELAQSEGGMYHGRELPLGYFMGMWGSAFAVDMRSVLQEFQRRLTGDDLSDESLDESVDAMHSTVIRLVTERCARFLGAAPEMLNNLEDSLKNEHFGAATIANFASHVSADAKETLSFIDGGFYMIDNNRLNIAIMPLLHRRLNLITICDSSWELEGAPSLRAAEALARQLNLPFPKINYEGVDKRIATMFVDEDNLDTPVIVYMPGIANSGYHPTFDPTTAPFTGTTNFTYTQEQSEQLMGLLDYNVLESREVLRKAVIKAIERKRDKEKHWVMRAASKTWSALFS